MPVLSVKTRRNDYAMLRNVALKSGIQLDLVEVTEGEVYADLIGDARRTIEVSLRANATRLCMIDQIEHGERIRVYPARLSS